MTTHFYPTTVEEDYLLDTCKFEALRLYRVARRAIHFGEAHIITKTIILVNALNEITLNSQEKFQFHTIDTVRCLLNYLENKGLIEIDHQINRTERTLRIDFPFKREFIEHHAKTRLQWNAAKQAVATTTPAYTPTPMQSMAELTAAAYPTTPETTQLPAAETPAPTPTTPATPSAEFAQFIVELEAQRGKKLKFDPKHVALCARWLNVGLHREDVQAVHQLAVSARHRDGCDQPVNIPFVDSFVSEFLEMKQTQRAKNFGFSPEQWQQVVADSTAQPIPTLTNVKELLAHSMHALPNPVEAKAEDKAIKNGYLAMMKAKLGMATS